MSEDRKTPSPQDHNEMPNSAGSQIRTTQRRGMDAGSDDRSSPVAPPSTTRTSQALFGAHPMNDITQLSTLYSNAIARAEKAEEALRTSGWQTIDTAPTDGTSFIGWDGNRPFRCRMMQYYVKWPHEEGGPTFKGLWTADYYDSVSPEKPTHWQPLPAPPPPVRETP